MKSIPRNKKEANEFLKTVTWQEGEKLFTELKEKAEEGEPTIFSVTEDRYPKAYMMICKEIDERSFTFLSLFKKLTQLWSDGRLSFSDSFGTPGFTFNLITR